MSKHALWRTLLAAGLLTAGLLGQAQAADYAVTQASDDGTGSTDNTLSWAINQANGNTEDDTITLETDVTLAAALPDISSTMTIEGAGHTIDADGGNFSVLYITSDGTLTLNLATILDADKDGSGGGIYNEGTTTVTNSTVSQNSAGTNGGGIYNSGTVTVTNSTIGGNWVSSNGSGLYNDGGTVTLQRSIISGNTAANGNGGGIYNYSGTLTLTNSTVSNNTSFGPGGGIMNSADITLTNSTVSNNTSSSTGGGVRNTAGGTVTLQSCIISGNTGTSGNEVYNDNTIAASNFNVFGHSGETSGQAFFGFTSGGTDDVNATSDDANIALSDILETTLADNGGPTMTLALVAGSPAIDRDATCNGGKITTDQRGYGRPVGSGCDAGAFEYGAVPIFTVTASAGDNGSIDPDGEQPVNDGETISFTVTADAGYTAASTVGGTCPEGTWDGSVYTTGTIDADCSVEFSFTADAVTFTVTPSAGVGGSISPTGEQAVNDGETTSFTVTPDAGYTADSTVGGTCPEGTWADNIYTTGAIVENCSVAFSFDRKINMAPIYKLLLK